MRLPTALCLLFTTAIAAPVPPKQEVLHNEKTTCATIDTYTVQYFIDNVVPTKRPPSSTCLFYTWGLTEKARLYAQTHGKTTIWVSPTHLPASTPLIPPPTLTTPGYLARRLLPRHPLRHQPPPLHHAKRLPQKNLLRQHVHGIRLPLRHLRPRHGRERLASHGECFRRGEQVGDLV